MSDQPIVIKDPDYSRDNEVRPFQIEGENFRGRVVRLGTAVDEILKNHNYSDAVARILGEFLVLTSLLGSMMKFKGIVTIQVKSSGALPMLVADYENSGIDGEPGHLRGYAQVDEKILGQYGKNPSYAGLVGSKKGYMALTIDQGDEMERYQGIVDLKGETLSEVARNYFLSSEQTPTEIKLSCDKDPVSGFWRAGGIMLQHLARGEEGQERLLERAETANQDKETWERATIFTNSVKEQELQDPSLTSDALLYRLFHEDGVRVFDASHVAFQCRCSRDKLYNTLKGFSAEDLVESTVDGKITVNCQFCSSDYVFDPEEFSTP
ncbi:Hsp33 family molecular chaperone HslO [Temperatibacter marinus]|uniref:Hsp33 family molecular chaperone HslO n=1 Tax=Temperatibacter marinus TaxID=1456591 RepID=A0AA52EGI8_9PROT|nr:Hsp33 family molecular chaperone HslO [Temperatibacter marinus]WND03253.1 Hsp33 family molecular chaperone HslO [Temperatibacter marinus]